MSAPRPAAERQQVVTFALADDLFAVDVQVVERVLHFREPAVVPNLPNWVRGVVEYAGQVVPVIDLRRRFELPDATAGTECRIVVFGRAGSWVAAVVDAVHEVSPIDPALVTPPPPLFRGLTKDYLLGVLRRQGRLVMLLDPERLLSATERIVLARALADG